MTSMVTIIAKPNTYLRAARAILSKRILRSLSTSQICDNKSINVTFALPEGPKLSVKASPGDTIYDIVKDNNIDIDGYGVCEASMNCTTCHVTFSQDDYNKLKPPSEDEQDMLDFARNSCETSRLGCQVVIEKEHDGLEIVVPATIADMREIL